MSIQEKTEEVQKANIDSLASVQATALQKTVEKKQEQKKETEQKGSVEIKGKTDSANSFTYENVVGSDTLSISITGNADFTIKNSFTSAVKENVEEVVVEKLDVIAELSRKVVAQKTIKEVATEIKKSDVQVKVKNFTMGAWLTWLLWGLGIICAVAVFYYIGGKVNWKEIFKKLKK